MLQILPLLFLQIATHGILTNPPARPAMAIGVGIKYQPRPPTKEQLNSCMNVATPKTSPTIKWIAGQPQKITWNTTIPHTNPPGVRVAIQFNLGEPFVSFVEGGDVTKGFVMITLPNDKTSKRAVVQWMWDSKDDNGFYLGCGDVEITAALTKPTSPIIVPQPTTAPASVASNGKSLKKSMGVGILVLLCTTFQ